MKNLVIGFAFFVVISTSLEAKTLRYRHIPSRFESAHSVGLDTRIDNGVLYSNSGEEEWYREEILAQLFYLVGALNAHQSVAELAHLKLTIKSVEPENAAGFSKVNYSASFVIGWSKSNSIPSEMYIPVPMQADGDGIESYFNNHKSTCSENPNEPDLSPESFYYYYRPESPSCRIMAPLFPAKDAAVLHLKISMSQSNTSNKYPEYEKVWEDGKLVGTIIAGTDQPGANSNTDIGISSYNSLVLSAQKSFGRVLWMKPSLLEGELPGMSNPDVEMEIELPNGKTMNLNFLLIDKHLLQEGSATFEHRYNQRTRISDFVSYNGHSGFGENIRALAKMGKFEKGKYQLYYVNGCDTFAYVDDALALAHQEVNPESGLYRYFDIITNAMPSSFSHFIQTNFAILNGMISTQPSYRDIFMKFNSFQKAIVMGEEDNRWPRPF